MRREPEKTYRIRFSRRSFVALATAAATDSAFGLGGVSSRKIPRVRLVIDFETPLAKVPEDFVGLSYESGQLASPSFFSSSNPELLALLRELSPAGVLRLGGNLSEFTHWSPEGGLAGARPQAVATNPDADGEHAASYMVTPETIHNLRGFLDACGWRCIYGLNLAGATAEQALAEATFVAEALGPRLLAFQLGNEPDLFKHSDRADAPWTYSEYISRWTLFRDVLQQKLPGVKIAGPDTAISISWLQQFAEEQSGRVSFLSSHHYAGGPSSDPNLTAVSLLHPGERFAKECLQPLDIAKAAGLPYRLTEVNSCYGGGKAGVSDVFASALWAVDLCLRLASLGCAGVHFHGGGNGLYTPIAGSEAAGFSARPEFYGILFAQRFAGRTLSAARLQEVSEERGSSRNVTTFVATNRGVLQQAAMVNKDDSPIEIEIQGMVDGGRAWVSRLTAPSLLSKEGITFAAPRLKRNGSSTHAAERLVVQSGRIRVHLPAFSAALIEIA